MIDAEMRALCDPRGCFLPGGVKHFSVCGHCGHPDIDWARKAAIDAHNAKDKLRYKEDVAKYNQAVTTMKKGDKSLKKPVHDQKPLLIRCNCSKTFFSWYNGTCPNDCEDCMFVCSTTNYTLVCTAVMEKKNASTSSDDSAARIDHARQFLRGGDNVR